LRRFDIVLANRERASLFVDSFHRLAGFDPAVDRVVVMDCSREEKWAEQTSLVGRLTSHGLRFGSSLRVFRRRNWNFNQGAQLDYFRLLMDGTLEAPALVFFLQDHYLDTQRFVKEDTVPADAVLDLQAIARKFEEDVSLGCAFASRYGIRVSASNPVKTRSREFFGDGDRLLSGARRRALLVDGSNFVARPQSYLRHFEAARNTLTAGDGSMGFCLVWEARLGRILYDQRVKWLSQKC
jgi:hypothetical protein